jgi:hypothetical protein
MEAPLDIPSDGRQDQLAWMQKWSASTKSHYCGDHLPGFK